MKLYRIKKINGLSNILKKLDIKNYDNDQV